MSKDTVVEVYNFTIAENNNYFVGKTGILVHNTNCLVDKIKNNFPSLHSKFSSLTDGQKAKFLKDFPDDDAILGVLNQGKAFEAWKKLSEITGTTKAWISKSKAILERVNTKNLSDVDIEKLKNYYEDFSSASDVKTYPSRSANGIWYDDFGHPDFRDFVPVTNGKRAIFTPNPNGTKKLTGKSSDMTNANNWALDPNGGGYIDGVNFEKTGSGTGCKIKQVGHPNADSDGWVTCTWHHHEDGLTMIPVPSAVHIRGNAAHIGGRQAINEGIVGFFDSPIF
ncbi:hypothetical protein BWI92_25075 [Flectobacillus sp. BAB-3569]|nr:hypothetical protein BWI92_25075 [Flectobacillus sp. BAB-3569]